MGARAALLLLLSDCRSVGSNSYYRYSVQYEYSVWYNINKESGRKAEVKILRFVLLSYTVLPVMSTM